jgi:hypothetical protein
MYLTRPPPISSALSSTASSKRQSSTTIHVHNSIRNIYDHLGYSGSWYTETQNLISWGGGPLQKSTGRAFCFKSQKVKQQNEGVDSPFHFKRNVLSLASPTPSRYIAVTENGELQAFCFVFVSQLFLSSTSHSLQYNYPTIVVSFVY